MLRSSVLALACLAVFSCGPARAEAVKAEAAAPADAGAQSKPFQKPAVLNATSEAALDSAKAPESASPAAPEAAKSDPPSKSASDSDKAGAKSPAADRKPGDAEQAGSKSQEPKKTAEPAKPAPLPEPTLTAQIDLGSQEMTVSEHGQAKYHWAISSGTSEHPSPRGTFHPQWTSKMWYSKKYDNAPMPNAVFISGGVAIHATYATGMLGRPASHGCIRLAPANAATFYKLVHQHGLTHTRVAVFGTPNWHSPAVASRQNRDRDSTTARRYVQRDEDSGCSGLGCIFGGSPKPKPAASAYDRGFAGKKVYRRPPPPPGYVYADQMRPRVYRSYDGSKVYYVQRPPRRYYTNGYSASN
jgi:lipoprotein-anchoring transpeptidase ErfK/SrfK